MDVHIGRDTQKCYSQVIHYNQSLCVLRKHVSLLYHQVKDVCIMAVSEGRESKQDG